jgi:menaquinone-dependent protoporphyrinogen oxidase
MNVLVTTASKHGSTDEIGARISSVIGSRGHHVELRKASEVRDVEPYDVVVLGSAVYGGHWQRAAKDFVEREGTLLAARPVWLFSSGPVGGPMKPEDDPAEVDALMRALRALEHHVFGGKIDNHELSSPERAIVRALHVTEGDYRDWGDVELWASSIADSISSG